MENANQPLTPMRSSAAPEEKNKPRWSQWEKPNQEGGREGGREGRRQGRREKERKRKGGKNGPRKEEEEEEEEEGRREIKAGGTKAEGTAQKQTLMKPRRMGG